MVQVTFTLNDIHDSFTLVFQQLPDNYPKQRTVTYASNARLTASCTLESITWAKNKQTNKQTKKEILRIHDGFEVHRQPIKKLFFTVLTTGWLPWLQKS